MLDLTKLTDEEVAFLQFTTEKWSHKDTKEQGFGPSFNIAMNSIQTVVFQEFRERGLSFQRLIGKNADKV